MRHFYITVLCSLCLAFAVIAAPVHAAEAPEVLSVVEKTVAEMPTEEVMEEAASGTMAEKEAEATTAGTDAEDEVEEAAAETDVKDEVEEAAAETDAEDEAEETVAETDVKDEVEEAAAESAAESEAEETVAETDVKDEVEEAAAESDAESEAEETAVETNAEDEALEAGSEAEAAEEESAQVAQAGQEDEILQSEAAEGAAQTEGSLQTEPDSEPDADTAGMETVDGEAAAAEAAAADAAAAGTIDVTAEGVAAGTVTETAVEETALVAAAEAVTEIGQDMKTAAANAIKQMKLEVIDFGKSGYGDGQMLSSGGKRLLIDTYVKESWATVNKWLYDHNYTSFDIYISHYHDDHMDNVTKILNDGKYKVSTLYLPDFRYMTGTSEYMKNYISYYKRTINTAKSKGVKIVYLNKGSTFSVGDVTANVLWGNDYRCSEHDLHYINNNSLLTRFTCGETRYLNGGDLEAEVERQVLNAKVDVKADILKLNHHGGSTSNTEAFLKSVNASFCYFNFCGDSPSRYAKESFCYNAPRNANKYSNVASVRYNGDITYYVYDDVISQDLKRNYTEQKVYLYNKTDKTKLEGVVTQKLNTACTKRIDNRAYGDYSCSTSKKSGTHADEAWLLGNAGKQYYYRDNAPVTGWTKIDGHIYHFNTKTAKKDTGWKKYGGFTFYFNWAGQMQTGSVKIGNSRYHFNEYGHQTKGGWAVTDGNRYFVNPSTGTVVTGASKVNGKLYYFGSTGILVRHPGFIKIGGKVYYGCQDGSMKTGWLKVNGKTYFMDADGARHTGWLKRGSKRFYFASDGAMVTQNGFVKLGGKTYYVCKDGSMKTGWLKTGGNLYYMNSDGSRHTGWLKVSGKLYYMNADGTIYTGWLEKGSKRFYFDSNGVMMRSC